MDTFLEEILGKCLFYLREGTRQAGMRAFPFAAACERGKHAQRVSHRLISDVE